MIYIPIIIGLWRDHDAYCKGSTGTVSRREDIHGKERKEEMRTEEPQLLWSVYSCKALHSDTMTQVTVRMVWSFPLKFMDCLQGMLTERGLMRATQSRVEYLKSAQTIAMSNDQ